MRPGGGNSDSWRPAGSRRVAPQHAIIFDGDDTLWITQWVYDQVEQEMRLIIEGQGLDGDRWKDILSEHEHANVPRFGFNANRYRTSAVAAYTQLCEESTTPISLEVVRDLNRVAISAFARKAYLAPGVASVLAELRRDYQLILLTKGDPEVQRRRIRESGLERYFDVISIVSTKNAEVFRGLLAEHGIDPARAWSVGNSLPSDIVPAVTIGMRGIWLEANTWDYEKRETTVPSGVERLACLRDLPAHLERKAEGPMRRHHRSGHDGLAS